MGDDGEGQLISYVGPTRCEVGTNERGQVVVKFEFSERERMRLQEAVNKRLGIGAVFLPDEALGIAKNIQEMALALKKIKKP